MDSDARRDLTDGEKLQLLPGLMRLNRHFLRAWSGGMLVAHSEADQQLINTIADDISLPETPPEPGDLVPLNDAELLELADRVLVRLYLFRTAYLRGIMLAQDTEHEEVLHAFSKLWGPPSCA